MTLTEVLVASAMTVLVTIGIITIDRSRIRIEQDLRRRSAMSERGRTALAALQIEKHLETADRIALNTPAAGMFQFRTPSGCGGPLVAPGCFDISADYSWDQYRLNGGLLEFNTWRVDPLTGNPVCGTWQTLAAEVTSLGFQYLDDSPPPPGGDPPTTAPEDNNLVEYTVVWNNGATSETFRGQVTVRAGAYTDIATGLQDPDDPSLGGDLSPPPAACP